MGVFWSSISNRVSELSSDALEHAPITFARADDYTPAGLPRQKIREVWDLSTKSMITLDLPTRRLLYPVIQNRIKILEASQKYSSCELEDLLQDLPEFDEQKIFDMHDLFQVFEVDGDGLIEINEMCVGLDNLGDKTPTDQRVEELCRVDSDGTGSIDFEEFLHVIYNLEIKKLGVKSLANSFRNADQSVRFIRHMSSIQQLQAGFL